MRSLLLLATHSRRHSLPQRQGIGQISCLSNDGLRRLPKGAVVSDNNPCVYATINSSVRQCCPSSSLPCITRYFSSTYSYYNQNRPDPFDRRPNAKCDPYGQSGKPLPLSEAKALLVTVDPQWKITDDGDDGESKPPQALVREFVFPDFMAGSKFLAKIAAVAQLNIHFPSLTLERRIIPNKKAWQVVTTVRCHTLVLGGLSTHDFHLAMVSIDCHAVSLSLYMYIVVCSEFSSKIIDYYYSFSCIVLV